MTNFQTGPASSSPRATGWPGRAARLLCLLGGLALSNAVLAQDQATDKAIAIADLLREVDSAVVLAGGLALSVNKPALREGEVLVITVNLPHAGYLNVISINPEGESTVLFPNRYQADNKVAAGKFTLPNEKMQFDIAATAPFGESRVAAFLTNDKLDLSAKGDGQRDAGGNLLATFAHLSTAGRDLINLFTNRTLQRESAGTPMIAGMTKVLSCAKTGPCTAPADGPGVVRRVVDAMLPGIFLDKQADLPQVKALNLRSVYERGVKLTKVSEGFVPELYLDAAGYCTIAYGHLIHLGPCPGADLRRYRSGITEPQGGVLLVGDLGLAQRAVMAFVKVPLNDGQYASLVDFTYNVGAGNLKTSTLLKAVNANQHERVPFQMLRWTKAGGRELRGLRTRREREIALYFDGSSTPKSLPQGEDTSPLDIRAGEGSRPP